MRDNNSVKRYELDQHARFDGASDHAAMALSGNGDWVSFQDYKEQADRIKELEAKLAKCQALMHAGLAEYQRRLVGVIEASIAVRSAQKTYFKDRSKDNLIASKQAETSLDKLLVELEGEIDD